jgi:ATP-dependent DNA ligase
VKEDSLRNFSFIEPMKALPVDKLPEDDWLYEIKHDGYRALAFKDGKEVRLVSRNKKAFDYPQVLDALKLLPAEHFTLDGEVAALDEKAAHRSSCSRYSKALEVSRWAITPLICSSRKARI